MRFLKPSVIFLALLSPPLLPAATDNSVTVSENENSFTLDNGIVTARVSKRSGDLISLKYKNLEMLDGQGQRNAGYWEQDTSCGEIADRVTIDPKTNGGKRGEVSVKGIANGNQMGNGPGGSVIADIEIRYALGRGDSGVYTYSIFSHPTNYSATSVGESRFCMKLNDALFDWMTVDAHRNMEMISTFDWNHGTPMNMKEARLMNTGIDKGQVEHKYDYSANQFDVRTWGWQSSANHLGLWFINPSVEYLSGGPTKFELSAHRDATFTTSLTAPAPPTLLNYWRGSHYGGSLCNIAATDNWTKVIGPFLIYCNSGATHDDAWKEALAREKIETAAWPFDWVNGIDYPHKNERATVSGKITVNDPPSPGLVISNLLVGLAAPDYSPNAGRSRGGFGLGGGGEDETNNAGGFNSTNYIARSGTNVVRPRNGRTGRGGGGNFGGPRIVEWQNDAKHYEFWVRGDADGNFSIPNVRAGNYTLHAIADGVLGELTLTNLTVTGGQNLALGNLNWRPVRFGRQLWDIGIPNRSGAEFFKGDDYFHWGWYLQYPKLFPTDVNFVVGKSDFHRDWFFEQVPYNDDTNNVTGGGRGSATTWAVIFNLPDAPHGKATLRLALCGVGTRSIAATMNNQSIGNVNGLIYNATINRDGIGGSWGEHDLAFNAALMKADTNTLELTIPAGGLTSGIIYDYLRLEVDENATPPN